MKSVSGWSTCVRVGHRRARWAATLMLVTVILTAPVATAPGVPANLSATVAGTSVTLAWTPPTGSLGGYRIEAGTAPGLSNVASALTDARPSLFIANIAPGTYYVRVRAVAADGISAPSNEVVVTVGGNARGGCAAPPASPHNLTATVTGSAVTLSWSPSDACAASYTVHAGSFQGGSDLAVVQVGAATSLSASAPDGVYHVRVIATNAYGSAVSGSATLVVGAAAAPAASPRLRVMTWNIQHGKTKAGVYDPVSQAQFIAAQGADVVALQEVQTWDEDQPARYERLLEQFTGADWTRQWAPVVNTARTEGNVILTRLPVVAASSHQMHATGDWSALYSNRSAARMTVSVGGAAVHVFSTHLDYYSPSHRTAQLLDLMEWTRGFGTRRIVAGDFNSTFNEYWITTMLGDYTDTWRDVTGSSGGGATINGVRFDYLFRARDGAAGLVPVAVRAPGTTLSDHAPVVAEYAVVR